MPPIADQLRLAVSVWPSWGLVFVGLVGACVGSFLNVVIWRLPVGQSLFKPDSRCPSCLVKLRWRDNLPVVGWLLVKRRCGRCWAPVASRYPLVEALTAALAVVLVRIDGYSWATLATAVFVAALVAITFIDLDHFIIPNVISYSGIVLGLVFTRALAPASAAAPAASVGWLSDALRWWVERRAAVGGIVLGGGSLYVVALAYWWVRRQEGMGGGDVKMLAMIGAFLGWQAIPFTILVASLSGVVIGIASAIVQRGSLQHRIPFGPFLAFGALAWVYLARYLPEALRIVPANV
ncbi:MAG: prepilin peptidase [bacterium]